MPFDFAGGPTDQRPIIVDCFAGGGGVSLGVELALGRSPDIAINHDPVAVEVHSINYVIERQADGTPVTKTDQGRLIDNAVPPQLAAAVIRANAPALAQVTAPTLSPPMSCVR